MTKPNFEISADTRLLYQVLARVQPGQTVSYARLSEAVGYAVSGSTTHLQSALRMATTNDEAVFDNIRGEGYRRLTDEEIISAATRDTDSLRRKARRAARKLATVSDFSAMPPEAHRAQRAAFALRRHHGHDQAKGHRPVARERAGSGQRTAPAQDARRLPEARGERRLMPKINEIPSRRHRSRSSKRDISGAPPAKARSSTASTARACRTS